MYSRKGRAVGKMRRAICKNFGSNDLMSEEDKRERLVGGGREESEGRCLFDMDWVKYEFKTIPEKILNWQHVCQNIF